MRSAALRAPQQAPAAARAACGAAAARAAARAAPPCSRSAQLRAAPVLSRCAAQRASAGRAPAPCRAADALPLESDEAASESEEEEAAALPPPLVARTPQERRRLLLAAIKPPIYAVALVPVLVGFAAAYYDTGVFVASAAASYALCACLVIAWLNLSNDAWDAETSVDVAKAESVVRLTGSVATVHALAALALALGGGGLAALAAGGGDVRVAGLLAAALWCGVLYQAPPFRLSYKGLGEPLCFVAFGPLATSAFYLAALAAGAAGATSAPLGGVSAAAAAASVLVGATTTAILFCSHFHQEATDAAAGKRSPIVRLGTRRASAVLSWGVAATHAFAAAAAAAGALPPAVAAALLLAVPAAARLRAFVQETHADPSRVFRAKFFATRWHALCGLLLAGAFAAARELAAA